MKVTKQQPQLFSSFVTLGDVPYSQVVKYGEKYVMRVKPTQFLLNSNLVADVLNRGDCFVCNIETGTLYIMNKEIGVELVDATMYIQEKE